MIIIDFYDCNNEACTFKNVTEIKKTIKEHVLSNLYSRQELTHFQTIFHFYIAKNIRKSEINSLWK